MLVVVLDYVLERCEAPVVIKSAFVNFLAVP
jgi:hypothetical protein